MRIVALNTFTPLSKAVVLKVWSSDGNVSIALTFVRDADLWSPTQISCNGLLLREGPRIHALTSLLGDSVAIKG